MRSRPEVVPGQVSDAVGRPRIREPTRTLTLIPATRYPRRGQRAWQAWHMHPSLQESFRRVARRFRNFLEQGTSRVSKQRCRAVRPPSPMNCLSQHQTGPGHVGHSITAAACSAQVASGSCA